MTYSFFKDKGFYKKLLAIALPITVQNLISSSLNMVDTILIGDLGETQIAAVGLANQLFFLFNLIAFGINSGASIFIAQFWGKKDVKNIRKVLGISLISGGIISVIFTLVALLAPEFILSLFSNDPNVVSMGSSFLRIISFSYLITAVSFSFSFASRSVGEAKLPMLVSGLSLLINTVLNYLLIFGKLGFPRMEVRGSALATLIARIVEASLLLWIIYKNKGPLAGRINEMFSVSMEFIKKFFITTIPVILNEGFWALGMIMYSAAYARIGTGAVASIQISNTVQNLFMVIFFGMGNACAVMIGNEIGAKKEETAVSYAKKFSVIGPLVGIIMGIGLAALSPLVLKFFNVSNDVYDASIKILIIMSIFMAIKVFNIILVVGILRSGGDTRFSMFLEMGSVWLVGVPLAFLGALVWKLPIYWVVVLVSLEEVVKASIGIPRVISKRWVRNVVEHM